MSADVVVVGGGPHGLAVLAALAERPEPWPERVVVVDPHEGWATAWDEKLARLDLDRLRSPQVHHPGQRPMALRDLVEAQPAADQLTLRRPEAERVPTPAGMRALVDELVGSLGPVDRRVGRVRSVTLHDAPAPGQLDLLSGEPSDAAASAPDDLQAPPYVEVTVVLEDGSELRTKQLVLAHNPSAPRMPDWAEAPERAGRAVHASAVDLRDEPADMAGRHVAIVGGGLTAGSLAVGVLDRGGRVTLLTRRELRARPYDVDASWLGPRRLAAYEASSPRDRRALIDVARDGGTMPPRVLDELWERERTPDSGLVIREAVDVDAEIRELLAEEGLESGGGEVAPPVDSVWLATGFANDVTTDPLVGPLVTALGIPVHGGLPEVGDDLRLPGSNVFVAGPYAALGVGPASRNLAGARPAAARIAAALVGAGD